MLEQFTALQACCSGCANSSQLRCLCANSSAACAQQPHARRQAPGHPSITARYTARSRTPLHGLCADRWAGMLPARAHHFSWRGANGARRLPVWGRPRALLGLAVAQRGVQLRQRVAQVQHLRVRVRGVGLGSRQRRAQLAQLARRRRARRRLALRLMLRACTALRSVRGSRAAGSASA